MPDDAINLEFDEDEPSWEDEHSSGEISPETQRAMEREKEEALRTLGIFDIERRLSDYSVHRAASEADDCPPFERLLDTIESQKSESDPVDQQDAPPTDKPKARRGRRSTAERDLRIYNQFTDGFDACSWKKQTEYLQKEHPERVKDSGIKNALSWLSKVLNRAKELKREEDRGQAEALNRDQSSENVDENLP